ncbi:MAG: XRE family transcriptional regulator [Nitrospinota bacterium]
MVKISTKALGRRLKEARKPLSQRAFALKLGKNPLVYRRYEEGERFPPIDLLVRISAVTNRSLEWLLGLSEEPAPAGIREAPPPYPQVLRPAELRLSAAPAGPGRVSGWDFRAVPLVEGTVAAGLGHIPEELVLEYALVRASLLPGRSDLVAIRVEGESMVPFLQPGAVVAIDREDKRIEPAGIYAVRLKEGGVTVKRVRWLDRVRALLLTPAKIEEPEQTIQLAAGEIPEDYIVGRIVWAHQPFV